MADDQNGSGAVEEPPLLIEVPAGVGDEGFGELEFGLQGNLSKIGIFFKGRGGNEIELMSADAGNRIERFWEVSPHDDVTVGEEAKEGRNLGFSKLPCRPESGSFKKNSGEEERRRFGSG